ncbi:MAG: hypothetical protein ACI4ET_12245 [Bilifractor sp.]
MDALLPFLIRWSGVFVSVLLLLISIISTATAGVTRYEKKMSKDDDPEHYIMRNAMSGVFIGFSILLLGCVVEIFIGWLALKGDQQRQLITIAAEILIALITGLIYFFMQRKALCERVFVEGNRIRYQASFGKPEITAFDEIRTVKKEGSDDAVHAKSLTIRPNEGSRFKVRNTMSNYVKFAEKIDRDVKLPDLTKKKGRRSTADTDEEEDD